MRVKLILNLLLKCKDFLMFLEKGETCNCLWMSVFLCFSRLVSKQSDKNEPSLPLSGQAFAREVGFEIVVQVMGLTYFSEKDEQYNFR